MQADDDVKTLRWIEGFRELPADAIRRISSECRWRWYKPDQCIFSQNDTSRDVFFVVQGTVRITSYSPAGKEVGFRDITTGQCFGDLAAIDGRPRSAAAIAVSDSYLASMSVETYWQTLMSYPPVAGACLKRLANLVRALSDRVVEYSLLPVGARVALELHRLAQQRVQNDNGAVIDPAPTHAEIASRVATHREAVTKELRRLAKIGIIVQKGRKIVVTDMNALRSVLGGYQESSSAEA